MSIDPQFPSLSVASSIPEAEAAPEQYLISTLLAEGQYVLPTGVRDEMIRAHRGVHEFATRYQIDAGEAPPLHLIQAKFPGFVYTPGISSRWAANQVIEDWINRDQRKLVSKVANAVKDGAHGEAVSLMHDYVRGYKGVATTTGVDAVDWHVIDAFDEGMLCPVPPGYLADLTGGHRAGELWLVAALWGVGKSWRLIEHSGAALEAGWDVIMFSIEMGAPVVLNRLHSWALRNESTPAALMGVQERREAVEAWYADCGRFTVYGPDAGRVDASVIAAAITHPRTLVVIDYVGKMYTIAGQHAREDYKAVAAISSEIGEVAGMHKVPILAAVQLNRMGQVAGAMELERDPDLIMEISRVSDNCETVRKNVIKKARNTQAQGHWYTRFDAANAHFGDISGEEAMEIRQSEENQYL